MQALQIHREQLSEIKQWLVVTQGVFKYPLLHELPHERSVRLVTGSMIKSRQVNLPLDWLKLKVQINNKVIPREKVKKTFNLLQQHKVVLKS